MKLEQYLRSKLSEKLKDYIQIEKSSLTSFQNFSISHMKVEPKLVEEISQFLNIPLTLVQGSIDHIHLNTPWMNIFSMGKNRSSLEINIDGLKIKARLENDIKFNYLEKKKWKILERFTQQLKQSRQSSLTFLNKIKEYFFGSILIELKNVQLQINVQLKHNVAVILQVQSLKYHTKTSKFQVKGLSLGYKLLNQRNLIPIVYPVTLELLNEKQKGKKVKKLYVKQLEININNQNFNDIRRILALIEWHNSFVDIPQYLWTLKSPIILKKKPKLNPNFTKFKYFAKIINHKFKENKNFKKILEIRRKYLRLYDEYVKQPNEKRKSFLEEFQRKVQLWRIKQYRRFYHLLEQQKNKSVLNPNIPEKENEQSQGWLSSWFKNKEQKKLLNELETQLQKFTVEREEYIFQLQISLIRISLIIESHSGKQPFLNLFAHNFYYVNKVNKEISILNSNDDSEDEKEKRICVEKFQILFDKYCGYHQEYKQFIGEKEKEIIKVDDDEDEFEDFVNFIDCRISNNLTKIQIQPFKILFTNQIIEKFNIFKVEKINNNFKKAEEILRQEEIFEEGKKQKHETYLNCSFCVEILQSFHQFPCQSVFLNVDNLSYYVCRGVKQISVSNLSSKAYLKCKKDAEQSMSKHVEEEFCSLQLLRTSGKLFLNEGESTQERRLQINNITLKIQKIEHLLKIIQFFAPFKPKKKDFRPILKLKNFRKKQSIGEEFIDACENLNEHIVRSTTLSEITKNQKNIVMEKKTIKTKIYIESINIALELDRCSTSSLSLAIFSFTQNQSFVSENEKSIEFHLFDINKTIQNLKLISENVERSFKLQSSVDLSKKNVIDVENVQDEIRLSNQQISFIIYDNSKPKINFHIDDLEFQVNKIGNQYVKTFIELEYYQQKRMKKSPIIQTIKLFFQHEREYNKDSKLIKMSKIRINVEPMLIREIRNILDSLIIHSHHKYLIVNKTSSPVRIKSQLNTYFQFKYLEEAVISNPKSCEIIVNQSKFILDLYSEEREESFQIGQKFHLFKVKETDQKFGLKSNLRIVNHQQNCYFLVISYQKKRTNQNKIKKTIDFQTLSSAKKEIFQPQNKIEDEEEKKRRKSFSTLKKNRSFDDAMVQRSQQQDNRQVYKIYVNPSESVQLLLDSQNYMVEIWENQRGQLIKQFDEFHLSDLLTQDAETILTYNKKEEQEEYLTIKTNIDFSLSNIPIYTLNIYSPVALINKMPWYMSYRYSKEEVDVIQLIRTGCKEVKKRSYQVMEMEKVKPTAISRSRGVRYQQITEMQVQVGDYYKVFKLNWFVNIAKKKNIEEKREQNELGYQELLCLNNGKSQLQVVIQIKFTKNLLQMQIYPHYIILNLTNMNIQLAVREDQCQYPHLRVKGLQDETYAKEYLQLADQKLTKPKTLQELFKQYENSINIFTGSLQTDVKRYAYQEGNEVQNYNPFSRSRTGEKQKGTIVYGQKKIMLFVRKMPLFRDKVNLLIVMPKLVVINKSDWCFFIKNEASNELKRLPKHTLDYVLISSKVDIQACEEKEEISYNEWLKISLQTLGTIYYAKQMTSSNGYESKEYELRKKRLKKAPKIFYRIVMTKYEYGYQILIEESQYPPVSFINKCKARVKVWQVNQSAIEEMQNNEMSEYAPKTPHYEPIFKLFLAENYEFRELGEFNLNEGSKVFSNKMIKVSIEQYKDKKIVMIQDSVDFHISEIKNELLLEMVVTLNLVLESVQISFMNSHYKELSCLSISDIEFNHEQKTNKRYIKCRIQNMESYSFIGVQPSFLFHRFDKGETFKIFKKKGSQDLFNMYFVLNEHKHATILQKCDIKIIPVCIIVNADTIIYMLKAFYEETVELMKIVKKLSFSSQSKEPNNSIMDRNFIIESFTYSGAQITLKCKNLNRLNLFISKKSYNFLIKFITWMGDLRPISFNSTNIEYQQYTLNRMISLVDLKKLGIQFSQLFLHYPVRQLLNLGLFFAKVYGISLGGVEEMNTLKKIVKSFYHLTAILFASGDNDYVNFTKRYQHQFSEQYKDEEGVMNKIMNFKYAQWIYDEGTPKNKCSFKINRFQRYNLPTKIKAYDEIASRVKLSLDSYCGNKVYRKIQYSEIINNEWLMGVTEEWFVLYMIGKEEWIVVKPQQVLSLQVKQKKTKLKYMKILILYIMEEKELGKKEIQKYEFEDAEVDEEKVKEIDSFISQRKLAFYY